MRGRLIRWGLPFLLVAVAGTGAAMAASASGHAKRATVETAMNAKFGSILVAANGRTLYRYTLDRKHLNRCTRDPVCAKFWPRLLVKAGKKPTVASGAKRALVGTIAAVHARGMRQVTYAGFPLYFFAGDKKAGQVKGQGFDKQWYVINAKGKLVEHAAKGATPVPAPSTTSNSSSGGGEAWG